MGTGNDAVYKADSVHIFGDLVTSARKEIQGEEAKKWSYNMSISEFGRLMAGWEGIYCSTGEVISCQFPTDRGGL